MIGAADQLKRQRKAKAMKYALSKASRPTMEPRDDTLEDLITQVSEKHKKPLTRESRDGMIGAGLKGK